VVHSHEEGALVGLVVARLLGVPHVYDMGNGWGTVLTNFGVGGSSPAVALADRLESSVMRASQLVISQVPAVHRSSLAAGITTSHHIPNATVEAPAEPGAGARTRAELGVAAGARLVVYAGSFERYQGLEMLLLALADPGLGDLPVELALVGGTDAQVLAAEALVTSIGLEMKVHLVGMVDPGAISSYLDAADVLVSPRLTGSNTPLKLYSYLQAGKPIVATDIASHTQVLDRSCAEIVATDPAGFAAGIGRVLRSAERASSLAEGASRLGQGHSLARFVGATAAAYHGVGGAAPDEERTAAATERIIALLATTAPSAPVAARGTVTANRPPLTAAFTPPAATPRPEHHTGSLTCEQL
jgi:glycosyltransferase involved in cell wall biosynthesis